MTRRLRLGVAVAIPLIGLVATSSVGFAHQAAVDSGTSDDETAAPPTTALPALPPLPGTTGPVTPTVPATTSPVVTPTMPPTVPPTSPVVTTAPVGAVSYLPARDRTGLLMVELPTTWNDIDGGGSVTDSGAIHAAIWAAPDLEAFGDTFATPGILLEAYPYTPDLRPEVAARFDFLPQACTDGGETPYSDGVFTGTLHTWNYCDGGMTRNFVLTASPATMDVTVLLYAQTVTPEDEVYVNHAFETFNVVPGIPLPTGTVPPSTSTPGTVAPATTVPVPAPPPTAATVAPVTVPPVPVPTGPPAGG